MRGADLTAVIAWLEAGCDPAEAVKELRSHQDALSSQSLSLSEAREALKPFAAFAKYWDGLQSPDDRKFISVGDACKLTVGDVRRARSVLEMLAASNPQSACAGEEAGQSAGEVQQQRNASSALAPSKALENGPAGLADANTNPPLSDLSSLRKGAEVAVTDAARDLLFHLELYDFSERDPSGELNEKMAGLKAALVSGSREEQS